MERLYGQWRERMRRCEGSLRPARIHSTIGSHDSVQLVGSLKANAATNAGLPQRLHCICSNTLGRDYSIDIMFICISCGQTNCVCSTTSHNNDLSKLYLWRSIHDQVRNAFWQCSNQRNS